MSEFIPLMDMSGNGYTVVSENPLQARRGRQKDIVRADFTDHARKKSDTSPIG